MATDKIRIMISSRSNRPVFDPPVRLAVLRQDLKVFIESELTLDGDPVFEVWICEEDSDEKAAIVNRAQSRKKILKAIAKEMETPGTGIHGPKVIGGR